MQFAFSCLFFAEVSVGVLAKLASAMDAKLRVMKAMQGWKFDPLVEVLRCRMVRIADWV